MKFFLSSFGGICLIYSTIELFYRNGWYCSTKNQNKVSGVYKFKRYLFFSRSKFINIEDIVAWTIHSIIYDELETYTNERLVLEYKDEKRDETVKERIIEFKGPNARSQIQSLLNDFEKIMGKEIPIQRKKTGNKVILT